ncbi:hypothetical protein PMAYCL1PPCAC_02701 [Pristionchus mayeri]|uniref:Uncharacterized protein n=1 Tax=Pristionchus mayeri TaxID=1317129 RepID=A0AAN4Z280_9BILA|nr:hypothetical protein PMAYCL1PPCAC_02701 [Pristionchus mayeri]
MTIYRFLFLHSDHLSSTSLISEQFLLFFLIREIGIVEVSSGGNFDGRISGDCRWNHESKSLRSSIRRNRILQRRKRSTSSECFQFLLVVVVLIGAERSRHEPAKEGSDWSDEDEAHED